MNKKDIKLNEIIKINISQLDSNNNIKIQNSKLHKYKVLVKENDIIRICNHLNPNNKKESKSGFPFVQDLICIHIRDDVDIYEKTDGIIKFNDVPYKRLLSSSGNIRNSKVIFIKEELYDKVHEVLLCGMPVDMEFDIFAKYNSYYALANTDSTPVTFPNFVIVDDCELVIKEPFDVVKEIDKDKYTVIDGDDENPMSTKHKPFDGAGLVDISLVLRWIKDLHIDYIPSAFQFRCISGIKGNLYTFDIFAFAQKYGKRKIKDIFGTEWDLFDNDINCILTKSQFKFYKQYINMEQWKQLFDVKLNNYWRTFNISKYSNNYEDISVFKPLSYQPFQSLDLSDSQIEILCKPTVDMINNISTDVNQFLAYRGLLHEDDENNVSVIFPSYYEALKLKPELFNDSWIQQKIVEDINGLKNRSCKGQLFLSNSYETLIPDLVGLAQHAFQMEVTGCLKKEEVYNKKCIDRNIEEACLCRFPHVAMEWCYAKVVQPDTEFLSYISEGIMISCWDSFALKMNSADFDGEKYTVLLHVR